jgi:hypothetical protein
MSKPKGRYSKVYRRVWGDEKVRRLSKPPPSGFTLFMRLLTGPELTNVPGLFTAWEGGLANALHWPLEAFRQAFGEVSAEGLAYADWDVGLIWVPNAIDHNEPESVNVVLAWAETLRELPDCDLKTKAFARFEAWSKAKGKPWEEAWLKSCPMTSPIGVGGVCPNQEQDTRSRSISDGAAAKDLTGCAQVEPPSSPSAAPAASKSEIVSREFEPKPTTGAARLGWLQRNAPLDDSPDVTAEIPPAERNVVPAPRLPTRRERASADLMTCPLQELNARCKANPYDANNTPLNTRPEIVAINDSWLEAVGLANRKLGLYSDGNKPLLRILEALEVHSVERIMIAVKQAARDDWCRGRKGNDPHKCDVGSMTITVLSRLLEAADDARGNCSPAVAAMLEQAKRRETA